MGIQHRAGLTLLLVLAGCLDGTNDPNESTTPNPYADLVDSPIRGLTPDDIESLRTGAGMRLALPAELNRFPGPKHIRELADALELNESQRAAVEELYAATNEEARRVGEQVLARYADLDGYFRSGAPDATSLEELAAEIGALEGELRFIHLRAHVDALPLLTEPQRMLYGELRGYESSGHGGHTH